VVGLHRRERPDELLLADELLREALDLRRTAASISA
jgi:hypothetical protein